MNRKTLGKKSKYVPFPDTCHSAVPFISLGKSLIWCSSFVQPFQVLSPKVLPGIVRNCDQRRLRLCLLLGVLTVTWWFVDGSSHTAVESLNKLAHNISCHFKLGCSSVRHDGSVSGSGWLWKAHRYLVSPRRGLSSVFLSLSMQVLDL